MGKATPKMEPPQPAPPASAEIKVPKLDRYGNVHLSISITPGMYRGLVKSSRIKFGEKTDIAQIARMFIWTGILQTVPADEREV